jgi:pimeloyl-ACP methyl ester carboxylesterase
MSWHRARALLVCGSFAAGLLALGAWADCRADSVIMKNGIVYRGIGAPDRDNTFVYIWDGLKRVVVRDSKIERIEANNAFRTGEKFELIQPLTVHGGLMPTAVVSVDTGPWNKYGRRSFSYVGTNLKKTISMEQAIIKIGPHIVNFRGIDGFWVAAIETNQVPRSSIISVLRQGEQRELPERERMDERERVVRFLMDMGWHAEAKSELDRLVSDFPNPELKERAANARLFILGSEAAERRAEVDVSRRAQQYHRMATLLKSFNEKGIPTPLQIEARELQRREEQQHAADRALAADLRKLSERLPSGERNFWKGPLAEVTKALEEAPDAVRERFAAWRKAKAEAGASASGQFALAMSGYVAGQEFATPELKVAKTLWNARNAVREYMASAVPGAASTQAADLDALDWPAGADIIRRLELLTRIVQLMPPTVEDEGTPEKPAIRRVAELEGNVPTEYAVKLPPEYHPLRSYPAIVLLHSGKGPQEVIEEWSVEASRRGYILIAPEYAIKGQEQEYHYTYSEQAAAQLALRDARKRYSIDSDRIFAAGQLTGGNMAWDLALAHPDLFAGAVVISGLPAKFVPRYLPHHERMPMFFVIGDLAPAANEFVYNSYIKPLIQKSLDITYVEYHRRGLEKLPEEIPNAFNWMDRHRRDAYPKSFRANTARSCDDRFYGVVIREFAAGRTTDPLAAEVLGQNLNPATIEMKSSGLSNLVRLDVNGVTRLDVWLGPKLVDFKRKVELRINGKPFIRPTKLKLEMEPMLEDLRVRGDRQQIYWYRISAP